MIVLPYDFTLWSLALIAGLCLYEDTEFSSVPLVQHRDRGTNGTFSFRYDWDTKEWSPTKW